jgi:glutathione synthase/RimK-type ligase-like ATP-grasp enzyme
MYKEWLAEICAENGIVYTDLSYGWVHRLEKNGRVKHIAGHHFDGNNAAADRIACDKYACYSLLKRNHIPAVVHELLFDPIIRTGYIDEKGTWQKAIEYYEQFNKKVVIKPNYGWQGRDVMYCETPVQVEQALLTIFSKEPNACICPFYNFKHEYRVFYVFGDCPFIYGKECSSDSWKHNLSGGAKAFIIENPALHNRLNDLAKKAAESIAISFATVDIAELVSGELLVLEINAGVSAKRLLEQLPEQREVIKEMYTKAVNHMFKY